METNRLTVIYGSIYTVNASCLWADAVFIKEGVIQFVGTEGDLKEYLLVNNVYLPSEQSNDDRITVIDWRGKGMVMPGFIDAHIHAQAGALGDFSCSILSASNLEEALLLIQQFQQNNKHEKWINGMGWRGEWFENGIAPAPLLDSICDVPITLRRYDGHAVWANTKAMEIAGVYSPEFLQKYSGLVHLSPSGLPIGTFEEHSGDIFNNFRGTLPLSTRIKAVNHATNLFAAVGITGYHEALARGMAIDAYLESQKVLKVSLALFWDPEKGENQLDDFKQIIKQNTANGNINRKMRIRTIKLMLDGVVETKTALMNSPYCTCSKSHEVSSTGLNYFKSVDNFKKVVCAVDRAGYQLHIHAIGDKAIASSLEAIEEATRSNPEFPRRHNIAHVHVLDPKDVERFSKVDVVANFQPIWSVEDNDMRKVITPLLGKTRSSWQYPIKTFIESGAKYCFGSDWYVSPYNPLLGIHVAVNHKLKPEQEVWRPEERITLEQAIYGYTMGSAYATFSETETGSIEVGKAADLIFLNDNLFTMDPLMIKDVNVMMTMVDGDIIFIRK